jgi:hypothetical protein
MITTGFKTASEIKEIVQHYDGIQCNTDWCAVCGAKLGNRILIAHPSQVLGCLNIVLVCSEERVKEIENGEK